MKKTFLFFVLSLFILQSVMYAENKDFITVIEVPQTKVYILNNSIRSYTIKEKTYCSFWYINPVGDNPKWQSNMTSHATIIMEDKVIFITRPLTLEPNGSIELKNYDIIGYSLENGMNDKFRKITGDFQISLYNFAESYLKK